MGTRVTNLDLLAVSTAARKVTMPRIVLNLRKRGNHPGGTETIIGIEAITNGRIKKIKIIHGVIQVVIPGEMLDY